MTSVYLSTAYNPHSHLTVALTCGDVCTLASFSINALMLSHLSKQKPLPTTALTMGYRYVEYRPANGTGGCTFQIEPMFTGPDRLYVPSEPEWDAAAPEWARGKLTGIVQAILTHGWRRELAADSGGGVSPGTFSPHTVIPGSLESTPGGQVLEAQQLYNPDGPLEAADVRRIWCATEEKFALAAKGRVTIVLGDAPADGVFMRVSLPALRRNPDVTLDIREQA